MNQRFLYVANWKMGFTHAQTRAYCAEHLTALAGYTNSHNEIVLCPSFTELSLVQQHLENSSLKLGAQNCSVHRTGPYTGEISAQTLQEIGCTYCIVGHSERRQYHHESNLEIAAKVERLLEVGIIPLICIGETREEYETQQTQTVLQKQLDLITDVLNNFNGNKPTVCIAYEPVWAIGTGSIPDNAHLTDIFGWINQTCQSLTTNISYRFLYGGSVSQDNAHQLKAIPEISGFLIGSASLDFQKFKNIVS